MAFVHPQSATASIRPMATYMKNKSLKILSYAFAAVAWACPSLGLADTIYHCKAYGGGTFWTNGTCASKSALIDRIANVPGGMTFAQQVSIAEGQRAEAGTTITTTNANTQIYSNAAPTLGTKAVCESLSAQVTNYDAMARQPQSGQMQDWITAERKKVRDKQFSMRC